MSTEKNIEAQVGSLLLREAQLLDDWQLDEWLGLYTEDAIYWLPMDENADPRVIPSIIHESKQILEVRVEQLMRQNRHAQAPRSEMMRMITNMVVSPVDSDNATARYNLLLVELRSGDWRQYGLGEKRLYGGRCDARLRRNAEGWRIAHKKITLLDRHQPIDGLSFIL